MKINEVDPRNFDSDIDYYNALNAKPKARVPSEPRPSPAQQAADDEDAISQQRQSAHKAFTQKRAVKYVDKEGSAPNGKEYNKLYVIQAQDSATADHEEYMFDKNEWGAKKVVDVEKSKNPDGSVTHTLYIVDNHKYGMWKPWKDKPAIESSQNSFNHKPDNWSEEFERRMKQKDVKEFAPAGRDPWGNDDEPGDDPYSRPDPKHYSRSIDYFGQFEADHFDREDMNDATGEFKGYWDYDGKLKQIAYFKFDNPKQAGSDDPGMGWYYEPNEDSGAGASVKPAVDTSAQRKQQELGMIDAFLKSGQKAKPGSQIYSLMKKHGLAENYPKNQDLSGVSTEKLKAYLAKQSQQSVPGEGGQVKRVQAELQRRSQGVAEAGPAQGEYSRVLTALRLYYPRFEIEELNTPDWHRVIANKANVTPEYAGQVIDDFVKASQPDEEENLDWMDDTNDVREGVAEATNNPTDVICVDVPLFIRLMEYAREDASTDMDLHDVAERLIRLSAEGETVSMSSYDEIVGSQKEIKEADMDLEQGRKNILSILKAAEQGQDAEIMVGNEPITLEYPEARFVGGRYKSFLKAGRQEEFLRALTDARAFDRIMIKMRAVLDKQKNFRGSVPGERGVEEGIVDTIKAGAKKAFDKLGGGSDEELLQRLEKETGGKRPEKKDNEKVKESAPPGFDQDLEKKLLKQYKDNPERAYATMWTIHNKQKNESIDKALVSASAQLKENEYFCMLDKRIKQIPEGYKRTSAGYIIRK